MSAVSRQRSAFGRRSSVVSYRCSRAVASPPGPTSDDRRPVGRCCSTFDVQCSMFDVPVGCSMFDVRVGCSMFVVPTPEPGLLTPGFRLLSPATVTNSVIARPPSFGGRGNPAGALLRFTSTFDACSAVRRIVRSMPVRHSPARSAGRRRIRCSRCLTTPYQYSNPFRPPRQVKTGENRSESAQLPPTPHKDVRLFGLRVCRFGVALHIASIFSLDAAHR